MSPNLYFKYKYTKPKLDVCYDKLPMRHNPFSFQKIKKKLNVKNLVAYSNPFINPKMIKYTTNSRHPGESHVS